MANKVVPSEKSDVVVRMDQALKHALQAQALVEHRSLPNLIGHAAAVYLKQFAVDQNTQPHGH